ncbi:MAG: tetratricopeptide repeat-containing sulfotransferase family protein [Henriciella sp.]
MELAISNPPNNRRLADIDQALRQREVGRAGVLIERLVQDEPTFVEGWIAAARHAQMLGDFNAMRAPLARALELAPGSPLIRLMDVEAQIHLGDIGAARTALKDMEPEAKSDPAWLGRLSESYAHCGDFVLAERTAKAALALDRDNAALRYAYSSALIATGNLVEAEAQLDALIEANPDDYDAWYNRATLRKQTVESNHIPALKAAISKSSGNIRAAVQLNYALAHELEDLGRYDESFAALKLGADARRSMMAYRVEKDIDTMAEIASVFDQSFFSEPRKGCDTAGPVFVLGLPRSGSTLVDRILSAHPEVESLGELNDFPLALGELARTVDGPQNLVRKSAKLNMHQLGEAYLKRVLPRGSGKRYFIDKAPTNFLYIGLIAAALPNAQIIHLNRDPLDNALGMYKALFRMGYPFSYDFNDLARYMRAKTSLMEHWQSVLPGRVIDVHYEHIVADQEGETRRLLAALDLEWDPACISFHRNKSPSATASAAQVRRPLYSSSVGRWRRYEEHLQPLIKALGIAP